MNEIEQERWAARAVRKALSGLPEPHRIDARIGRALREDLAARRAPWLRPAQVALGVAVAMALSVVLVLGMVARQDAGRSPSGRANAQAGVPASSTTAVPAVRLPADPSQRYLYYAAGTQAAGADLTLHVLDWRGDERGVVRVAATAGSGTVGAPTTIVAVAPDGARLLTSGGEVLDQTGAIVGRIDVTAENGSKLWTEDDQHVCAVDDPAWGSAQTGSPAAGRLDLVGLDGSVRHIASVGRFDKRSDVSVVACSLSQDVVAVAQRGPVGAIASEYTDLWVFRLSTGGMLLHRSYAGRSFVVSPDGRYVAESAGSGAGEAPDVLSLPGGAIVAHIVAGAVPIGFSGDGSRLLYRIPGNGTTPTVTRLVSWSSGDTLWQAETSKAQVSVVADPVTPAMILAESGAVPRLILVEAAGTVRTLTQGGPYRVLFGDVSLPQQ